MQLSGVLDLFNTKIGSSCKFEDIETEIGTCFPIQVVVSVTFNSSVVTQINSKSKIATLVNKLCFAV